MSMGWDDERGELRTYLDWWCDVRCSSVNGLVSMVRYSTWCSDKSARGKYLML